MTDKDYSVDRLKTLKRQRKNSRYPEESVKRGRHEHCS